MLPENVRRAIHLEIIRLVDVDRVKQTALAKQTGLSQPTIAKIYDRPEIGQDAANKLLAALKVTKEDLLTRHKLRGPAPETDMLVRELVDWIEGSPAMKSVSRRPDVTVKDLLRLRKTPPAGGYADAERVYGHILQLREGTVGDLPGEALATSSVESKMRRGHGKNPRKPK